MDSREDRTRTTYLLVDGENIDATLGTSILGRRPRPEERPRWDRLLQFARDRWGQEPVGLFFLAANNELPMSFVQALLSMGYRPVPLAGAPSEKVVDIAIQRTLAALADRDDDVLLVSDDGDFLEGVDGLLDGSRRVGRRRVHRVPQPRVQRPGPARPGVHRPGVRRRGVHRPAAARPDHPDRRVRPARVPLARPRAGARPGPQARSSGGVRQPGAAAAGLQPGDRHPER